ncbi:MAG TPA: hypothetical protein VK928_13610 [Longimicrobiales bacterium]|nr:hypothetical protein [Longimicrobiales bacterium]
MKRAARMLVGSAVLLAACQDVPDPTAVDALRPEMARMAVPTTADDESLARAVPAYGGLFLDEAGRPNVYVTDLSQADAMRARLANFARQQGLSESDIVVRKGEYSYGQLSDAFQRATHAAMPLAGSVFTDLDEAANRVVVGVENQGLVRAAERALANAGLERGSYEVIVTEPVHFAATLRDKFDPTIAGVQIHYSNYVCTLGANILDGTQRSFLTNSHCTATQGGVENTVYYQSSSSIDPTVIATEVEDPTYFKNGVCPKGMKCRYSDSSRALYSAARASSLGSMAVTDGVNTGSLNVTGTRSIVGKSNSVTVGMVVNKVGRTTGWTQAAVSRTCVNTGVQGSQIMQLCQHWVQSSGPAIVAGGDSGSTVWTGSSSATIVGLLWGGSSDNKTFIFSPIGQVEQELGTLTFN